MHIVHSARDDLTDIVSAEPIKVNSCGINTTIGKPLDSDITITRPSGRMDYQLVYMYSGKAQYRLDGSWHTVGEGSCVLYRPNEPQHYTYQSSMPCLCQWIHFSGVSIQKLLEDCGINESCFYIGVFPEIEAIYTTILKELQRQKPLYNMMANALLVELLALIGRQRAIACDKEGHQVKQRIMRTVEHMQHHYNEPLCIGDYACQCNMSYYHFEHVFRQQMGLSPYAQLIRIRMDCARELLSGSTIPVSDVARMCGYENPLYFSRAFTKECGISPSGYRRKETRT